MAYSIEGKLRSTGSATITREEGQIPGIIYGPDIKPVSLAVPYHAFEVLYESAGEASLIDVTVDGQKPIKALIQDVQYDPISERVIHVDFRQINLKKPMHATVELNFIGESSAVKELGGTLIKALSVLKIACLPQDLVNQIDVDLSKLKSFDDTIRVSDLALPPGFTVLDNADTTIAKVAAPLTEDQLKAMEEGAGPKSLEEIEVEKKGKEPEATEEGTADASPDQKDKDAKDKVKDKKDKKE